MTVSAAQAAAFFAEVLAADNAANGALAQQVADALAVGERTGRWIYETGRMQVRLAQ